MTTAEFEEWQAKFQYIDRPEPETYEQFTRRLEERYVDSQIAQWTRGHNWNTRTWDKRLR